MRNAFVFSLGLALIASTTSLQALPIHFDSSTISLPPRAEMPTIRLDSFDFGLPNVGASPSGCEEVSGVTMSTRWLTGLGHCSGEVAGYFENNTGETVSCAWVFHVNGEWADGGSANIRPGRTGGEGAGIYQCGADSDEMKFACFPRGATASNGADCTTRVRW